MSSGRPRAGCPSLPGAAPDREAHSPWRLHSTFASRSPSASDASKVTWGRMHLPQLGGSIVTSVLAPVQTLDELGSSCFFPHKIGRRMVPIAQANSCSRASKQSVWPRWIYCHKFNQNVLPFMERNFQKWAPLWDFPIGKGDKFGVQWLLSILFFFKPKGLYFCLLIS